MKVTAEILTYIVQSENGNDHDCVRFGTVGDQFTDVTMQSAPVGTPIVVGFLGESATLDIIRVDADYGDSAILFEEAVDETTP